MKMILFLSYCRKEADPAKDERKAKEKQIKEAETNQRAEVSPVYNHFYRNYIK